MLHMKQAALGCDNGELTVTVGNGNGELTVTAGNSGKYNGR